MYPQKKTGYLAAVRIEKRSGPRPLLRFLWGGSARSHRNNLRIGALHVDRYSRKEADPPSYTPRQLKDSERCTSSALHSKTEGHRPPEEEEPEHHPDKDHHQEGRHKESHKLHGPTVPKERPGGFRRGYTSGGGRVRTSAGIGLARPPSGPPPSINRSSVPKCLDPKTT